MSWTMLRVTTYNGLIMILCHDSRRHTSLQFSRAKIAPSRGKAPKGFFVSEFRNVPHFLNQVMPQLQVLRNNWTNVDPLTGIFAFYPFCAGVIGPCIAGRQTLGHGTRERSGSGWPKSNTRGRGGESPPFICKLPHRPSLKKTRCNNGRKWIKGSGRATNREDRDMNSGIILPSTYGQIWFKIRNTCMSSSSQVVGRDRGLIALVCGRNRHNVIINIVSNVISYFG